jgi:hypothetical protein
MADIAAVGKLAIAAQLCFWQRRRYALARSFADGVVIGRRWPNTSPNYFDGQGREPDLP